MKKTLKIISATIGIGLIITSFLLISGLLVLDNSAQYFNGIEEKNLYWKGTKYVPAGGEYNEGMTLAKTSDGCWSVNAIKEDSSHTFVVVRSFSDQQLFVREDYAIPKEGKVTSVNWNYQKITDVVFCQALNEICNGEGDTFEYKTDGIYRLTETQQMKQVYLGFNGCPISTEYRGYMGKINGQWVLTVTLSDTFKNGSYIYTCKVIPEHYIQLLQKYF